MKSRGLVRDVLIAVLLTAGGFIYAQSAAAEQLPNPFLQRCGVYHSSKHFVKSASYYCIHQRQSGACENAAARYFEGCGFDGDFKKMTQNEYAGMLFVLMVGRTPQMVETVAQR